MFQDSNLMAIRSGRHIEVKIEITSSYTIY